MNENEKKIMLALMDIAGDVLTRSDDIGDRPWCSDCIMTTVLTNDEECYECGKVVTGDNSDDPLVQKTLAIWPQAKSLAKSMGIEP